MDEREGRGDGLAATVDQILDRHREDRWPLIPVLQEVQGEFGHIPPAAIPRIAQALKLFPAQVQGVISFYEQLSTVPKGRRVVRVCRGTACHVRGGKTILRLVKQAIGVDEGETTPDFEYTLETVACIGVCALAPNVVVGSETHSNMNPKTVAQLFRDGKSEG